MLYKKEVKTFVVRLYCDDCGEEMISTGELIFTLPVQLKYKCPKCGRIENTTDTYPKTIYDEINL